MSPRPRPTPASTLWTCGFENVQMYAPSHSSGHSFSAFPINSKMPSSQQCEMKREQRRPHVSRFCSTA